MKSPQTYIANVTKTAITLKLLMISEVPNQPEQN